MSVYQITLVGHGSNMPVTDPFCKICRKEVTISQILQGDMHPSKIGGDSEAGYELYHVSCL